MFSVLSVIGIQYNIFEEKGILLDAVVRGGSLKDKLKQFIILFLYTVFVFNIYLWGEGYQRYLRRIASSIQTEKVTINE